MEILTLTLTLTLTLAPQLVEIAKPEFKARMAIKLAVAGAFHTDFMAPAVERLAEVLKEVEVSKPR